MPLTAAIRLDSARVDDHALCGSENGQPANTVADPERISLKLHAQSVSAEDPRRWSDEDLLLGYRDGGRVELFEELVRRHGSALQRFLTRYLSDVTLAEDVLQDTWIRVHAKCKMFREGRSARAWLFTFARHLAIDTLRRSARRRDVSLERSDASDSQVSLAEFLFVEDLSPLERLVDEEGKHQLRENLSRLPEAMRCVIELSYDQDLKYIEIADSLGIPLGTVKSRVNAAINRLGNMVQAPRRPRAQETEGQTAECPSAERRSARRVKSRACSARLRGWSGPRTLS